MTDLKQALAEGLYQSLWGDYRPDEPDHLSEQAEEWFDPPLVLAAAILATEPMQAIARIVDAAYGYWYCDHDDDARCIHWRALGVALTEEVRSFARHDDSCAYAVDLKDDTVPWLAAAGCDCGFDDAFARYEADPTLAADLALAAAVRRAPDDWHLFSVETLIDALAGTNINERDRKAYRDIFRSQAEDAIRYAKEAERD